MTDQKPPLSLVPPELPELPEPTALHKLVCSSCKRPITKGQAYAEVRLPTGETASVHGACMEKKR